MITAELICKRRIMADMKSLEPGVKHSVRIDGDDVPTLVSAPAVVYLKVRDKVAKDVRTEAQKAGEYSRPKAAAAAPPKPKKGGNAATDV